MSVVSYIFVAFLIITMLIYYIVPKKIQWVVILIANFVFYGYAGIKYLILSTATALIVYVFSLVLQKSLDNQEKLSEGLDRRAARKVKAAEKAKRKKWLVLALVIVIAILCVFKVTGFAVANIKRLPFETLQSIPDWNIVAPMGISFYTFMMISYLVDIYNGHISAQKNFLKYLTYALYFPHVTQGPIAKYEYVGPQIYEKHRFDYDSVRKGMYLILWGAVKKMVLADRLSTVTNEVFGNSTDYRGMIFLFGGVVYSIQIYCDFSGCMDIMRGASECLGIKLGENFRRPYFSQTLPEFWRRWHISLGAFFREYVFYPVSTSNIFLKLNTKVRKHLGNTWGKVFAASIPILCVWFLTGLWHGAKWNYICWGLFHGVLICCSTIFEQPIDKFTKFTRIKTDCLSWRAFRMLRTFFLCVIGRIIFMGNGVRNSFWMLKSIVVDRMTRYDIIELFGMSQREWNMLVLGCLLLLGVSIAQEILDKSDEGGDRLDIRDWLLAQNLWLRWAVLMSGILIVLSFGVYGSGVGASFIYEQF